MLAYSNAGVPLWTRAFSMAVNAGDNLFLAGVSSSFNGVISIGDCVTIKYSPTIVPIHLAISCDGSNGFFVRYTGRADVTYRLQRAASPNITKPFHRWSMHFIEPCSHESSRR